MKLLILFCLFTHLIFSQDYSNYYKGINRARISVAEGNAENSINSYYTTFENYDFGFARDCYNAIEIAVFAKDTIKLEYFIRRALKQGIDYQLILKIENLYEFHNSEFLKKIEREKDSLSTIYSKSINWEIRKEINEMFAADQAIRERYYNSILFKRHKIGKEWEDLNESQVERIIEITKNNGFPGERLIGIDNKEMHSKISDHNLSTGMPIVILIHHYSQPNKSYSSILFEQIKLGNLYNEHFATVCDFEVKFGRNKFENFGFFAFKQSLKAVNQKEIDQRRNEISLLSIEEIQLLNSNKIISKFWNRLY